MICSEHSSKDNDVDRRQAAQECAWSQQPGRQRTSRVEQKKKKRLLARRAWDLGDEGHESPSSQTGPRGSEQKLVWGPPRNRERAPGCAEGSNCSVRGVTSSVRTSSINTLEDKYVQVANLACTGSRAESLGNVGATMMAAPGARLSTRSARVFESLARGSKGAEEKVRQGENDMKGKKNKGEEGSAVGQRQAERCQVYGEWWAGSLGATITSVQVRTRPHP